MSTVLSVDADVCLARSVLQPSPVKRRELPSWVLSHVRQLILSGRLSTIWRGPGRFPRWAAADALVRNYSTLMDHWGTVVVEGQELLVTEPYRQVSMAAARQATELADLLECEVEIDPRSWHCPGETVRFSFRRGNTPI